MSIYNELKNAKKRVNEYFLLHYKKKIEQLEISNVPGYWIDKKYCENCKHPLHGFLFNESPLKHSYFYVQHEFRDKKGKFISPHKDWKTIFEQNNKEI